MNLILTETTSTAEKSNPGIARRIIGERSNPGIARRIVNVRQGLDTHFALTRRHHFHPVRDGRNKEPLSNLETTHIPLRDDPYSRGFLVGWVWFRLRKGYITVPYMEIYFV